MSFPHLKKIKSNIIPSCDCYDTNKKKKKNEISLRNNIPDHFSDGVDGYNFFYYLRQEPESLSMTSDAATTNRAIPVEVMIATNRFPAKYLRLFALLVS